MATKSSIGAVTAMLGDRFISPIEIMAVPNRSVHYPHEVVEAYKATLPSMEALEYCGNNDMVLMAGPPHRISHAQMTSYRHKFLPFMSRKEVTRPTEKELYEQVLQGMRAHSGAQLGPQWYIIGREAVSESAGKKLADQAQRLAAAEYVPSALEAAWCAEFYFLTRWRPLFKTEYVRTSSMLPLGRTRGPASSYVDGVHMYVGSGDSPQTFTGYIEDSAADEQLGLARMLKADAFS